MNTKVTVNPDTSENEYPKVMKVSNKPIETKEASEKLNIKYSKLYYHVRKGIKFKYK